MTFRRLVLSLLLLTNVFAPGPRELFRNRARAQTAPREMSGFDSRYRLSLPQPVQDKNFYLLSLFQRTGDVRKLLNRNQTLKQLAHDKLAALQKAESCNNVGCFEELLRFDSSTIAAVSTELRTLARAGEFKMLAQRDLRPSGVFVKYNNQTDAQMLVAAWQDAALGLNRILSVYCLGKDPRYKAIDKVSFDVAALDYSNLLEAKIKEINLSRDALFFEPALNFALKLLEINRRDEAARYEPLAAGENRAAVQNLNRIKWSDYPYSYILVLGSGPSDSARLSPTGAKRADAGAQLFLQHKAPLLILSGGHVHPMQTPYCEAIEMKKYLMEKYQIPETSILVDPQARHTTTNFRNSARLAFRYRIPTALALVTSSEDHIAATTREEFRIRCLNELGYFPVEFIKRISPVAAEFKPSITSLFFDASDPLDP